MTERKNLTFILAALFAVLATIFIGVFCGTPLQASAATTPRYTVAFSYTCTYQYNTTHRTDSSGTDTTSATVKDSLGKSTTISIAMYGSAASGTGTLANGGTIKSDTVNIVLTSGYQWHSISVTNSSGTEVGKSSKTTLTLSGLADGKYSVKCKESGQGWNPNPRAYATYYTEITFSFVVDTYVDNTKPTISGASTSSTGKYTNKSFTVTASDIGSGIDKLYWMAPNSGSYSSTSSTSKTISASSANGLYRFYATDKFGNRSLTYYVFLDTVAPFGTFSLQNGNTIASGGSTKEEFSFAATDRGSGVSKIEYKKPSSSSWSSYTAGTIIQPMTEQGLYYFRAIDKSGNASTYTITTLHPCADGHSYVAKVIDPTCTEKGYTVYTCSLCGDSYTVNQTQATGHNYVASIVESICTEKGYTIYTCSKCGDNYRDNETAPLGHNYVMETVSATCTEKGGTVYTCTRCSVKYSGNETEPLGHAYVTETVAPTCEEGGYALHTCSRCGHTYTDSVTQPLGHNFIKTTQEATCTEYGKIVYTCQVCGYETAESDGVYPTGHNYSNSIVKAATCTEDGERRYVCDRCGDEYTEVILAPGHSYAITDSYSENGKTVRTYTCMTCGDSYTQEMGDQYEEVSSYVEELFEQYRPYMIWVFLGTAAIWSIVMGVFFAIAQKNEEKEKAKKMIVNYFIGLVVIFAILVACPFLVRGIAVLVT